MMKQPIARTELTFKSEISQHAFRTYDDSEVRVVIQTSPCGWIVFDVRDTDGDKYIPTDLSEKETTALIKALKRARRALREAKKEAAATCR
jgi:hypothetical protein